jgi:hypothetical protein
MSTPNQLDRVFQIIMKRMMETGQAPHYTEIAAELEVPVEEGRKALHELFSPGFPAWLFPNTDYIGSFPPFSNLPTQYRITIDGQQKWFGQWGFESLAVSWLFPGKTVKVEAPCLDCGSQIRVEMRDGSIQAAEPEGIVGYTSVPFRDWFNNLPYAWSTMNLFRSEEHVRNWSGFKAGTEEGINKLSDIIGLFSGNLFTKRLDPDYATRMEGYLMEFMGVLKGMGSFWQPPEQ